MLLDAILDDFRAMPHRPEMPIDSLHKRILAVSKLLTDRVDLQRRQIERHLRDEVEPDWTSEDVQDLVDDLA